MPKRLGVAHTTEASHRVRVSNRSCAPNSQRNVTYSKRKGIKALTCCPRGEFKGGECRNGTFTRTAIYDKKQWTKREAEAHAKKRFM